jgi:hypothetical protein
MQILKSNPDGSSQTIAELGAYGSPAEAIEIGRSASEDGFVTMLGQFDQPLQGGGGETKPGDPEPPAWIPQILAVFNDGSQIACYIA